MVSWSTTQPPMETICRAGQADASSRGPASCPARVRATSCGLAPDRSKDREPQPVAGPAERVRDSRDEPHRDLPPGHHQQVSPGRARPRQWTYIINLTPDPIQRRAGGEVLGLVHRCRAPHGHQLDEPDLGAEAGSVAHERRQRIAVDGALQHRVELQLLEARLARRLDPPQHRREPRSGKRLEPRRIQAVQADVQPADARGLQRRRQPRQGSAVGGGGEGGPGDLPADPLHQVDQVTPHQRLAAGEADLPQRAAQVDATNDLHQAGGVQRSSLLGRGRSCRRAVATAQIAAVGDREPQVGGARRGVVSICFQRWTPFQAREARRFPGAPSRSRRPVPCGFRRRDSESFEDIFLQEPCRDGPCSARDPLLEALNSACGEEAQDPGRGGCSRSVTFRPWAACLALPGRTLIILWRIFTPGGDPVAGPPSR